MGMSVPQPAPRPRLAVIEDHDDSREVLWITLRQHYDVETFSGAEELLNRISSGSFDLFLIDIGMPQIDGIQLTRILRASGIQSPVIAVTAHATAEYRDKAKEAGFAEYITKPISDFASLFAAIERNLKRSQ